MQHTPERIQDWLKDKTFLQFLAAGVVFAIVVLIIGRYYFEQERLERSTEVICTLDAKICSDGSAVGRSGPNCEFAKCPNE